MNAYHQEKTHVNWEEGATKYCISNSKNEIKSDLLDFKECENREGNCFYSLLP